MIRQPAIDGNENILSLRSLTELHIISKSAFQTTLIIIGSCTLFAKLVTTFESIYIKFSHIVTDAIEILY